MTSTVVPTTKRSLVVLCHAMERAFMVSNDGCSAGMPGLVLGLFQRREYFDVEADRYAAFAAAGDTVIVGFSGSAAGIPDGVNVVTFEPNDPLAAQWALVLCRGSYGTSMVASDMGNFSPGEMTLESSRLFAARWTFQRAVAVADARQQLTEMATKLPSALSMRVADQLNDFAALPITGSETQLAAAADHLVYSVEAGQRRLIKLRAALDDTQSVAERDQLTGLYNRHFLERFLGGADRPAELVAMLVDVDNLKTINDTSGHDAGDAVLSAIAAILKGESRAGDVVIRWGGDEFLLLVPQMTEDDAAVYAQNVLDAVSSGHPLPPWNTLHMSVSIGMIPTHRTPLPLDQLDRALYQAKRAGKGRAVVSGNSGRPQDDQTDS